MKLLLKILVFIFTTLITTVEEVHSSTVVNILQKETLFSLFQKSQLATIVFENSCLNEEKVVAYGERIICDERKLAKGGSKVAVQFGKTPNQVSHAFRHTDALGLDRSLVQSTVQNHFSTVSSQVVAGQPFNQVIQIGGHNIQYTAYRLSNGTFNIGRIHAIP